MDKETREKLKEFKKQKRYDDIFINYGTKAYIKNTPTKYRQKELKKLKKEGRYLDIYNKYGEKEYNKVLVKARTQEIKEAKGSFQAFTWEATQNIKIFLKKLGINVAIGASTLMLTMPVVVQSTINKNAIKYEKEIENYDENISKYAEEVKSLKLNHLQTIMKVMDDMWKNIAGYANPEKDISGFLELDLATEDGYGVCRNMASDVAKKLNKIDERYNARTINVKMEHGDYQIANIERKVIETNETVEQENEQQGSNILENLAGNHMVTLVDIPDRDITLVADPTNPGLGIYENGEIKMFNTDEKWEGKEISTMLLNGYEGLEMGGTYVNSFHLKSKYSEAKKEFGLEKQNEALNYVRSLEKQNSEKSKEEKFRESLAVASNQSENIRRDEQNQDRQINAQEKETVNEL